MNLGVFQMFLTRKENVLDISLNTVFLNFYANQLGLDYDDNHFKHQGN
jgi:hypothetical protein